MKKINKDQLAGIYFSATYRMHQAVTVFYEDCYTEDKGIPKESFESIKKAIDDIKSSMEVEYDLIKTAIQEYNE